MEVEAGWPDKIHSLRKMGKAKQSSFRRLKGHFRLCPMEFFDGTVKSIGRPLLQSGLRSGDEVHVITGQVG